MPKTNAKWRERKQRALKASSVLKVVVVFFFLTAINQLTNVIMAGPQSCNTVSLPCCFFFTATHYSFNFSLFIKRIPVRILGSQKAELMRVNPT